jgi:xanthine dehydrogenase accessory factor
MPAGDGERAMNANGGAGHPGGEGTFVAATVVRAQSPTSVRAGDSAIVWPDGAIEGFVGGTCAEASVRLHSLRAMQTGEPLLLRILPGAREGETEPEEGAVTVANPCLSGGALEVFLEPHLPPATLKVVGETPIAAALADLAKRLGYAVDFGPADRAQPTGDDAAVVVASHGHDEERVLTEALGSDVPYVALVASQTRGRAVLESLDLPEEKRGRLHTPAGLEIGAETPEEIALSILAEIVAVRPVGPHPRAAHPPAARVPEADQASATERKSPEPVAVASTETAVDPICGMEVAVSPASIQLERDGEIHYFCSEGCRDSFSSQGVPGAASH